MVGFFLRDDVATAPLTSCLPASVHKTLSLRRARRSIPSTTGAGGGGKRLRALWWQRFAWAGFSAHALLVGESLFTRDTRQRSPVLVGSCWCLSACLKLGAHGAFNACLDCLSLQSGFSSSGVRVVHCSTELCWLALVWCSAVRTMFLFVGIGSRMASWAWRCARGNQPGFAATVLLFPALVPPRCAVSLVSCVRSALQLLCCSAGRRVPCVWKHALV